MLQERGGLLQLTHCATHHGIVFLGRAGWKMLCLCFSYGYDMVVSAANTTPVCNCVCAARLQQLLFGFEQHKTCCWQHCQAGQHHAKEEHLLCCLLARACGAEERECWKCAIWVAAQGAETLCVLGGGAGTVQE